MVQGGKAPQGLRFGYQSVWSWCGGCWAWVWFRSHGSSSPNVRIVPFELLSSPHTRWSKSPHGVPLFAGLWHTSGSQHLFCFRFRTNGYVNRVIDQPWFKEKMCSFAIQGWRPGSQPHQKNPGRSASETSPFQSNLDEICWEVIGK